MGRDALPCPALLPRPLWANSLSDPTRVEPGVLAPIFNLAPCFMARRVPLRPALLEPQQKSTKKSYLVLALFEVERFVKWRHSVTVEIGVEGEESFVQGRGAGCCSGRREVRGAGCSAEEGKGVGCSGGEGRGGEATL